jgi:hypothetical protein
MRYGRDYDRGYRPDLGRGPETNWMGRNYRTPGGGRPRGYDAAFGAGYPPRRGAWDVEPPGSGYDRPYRGGGYDTAFRARGGYDRPYREYGRGYDPGYRETGGMRGGGRILSDPWGPYSGFRQAQRRLSHEDRPWPHHFFTDHGHDSGHR